MERKTKPELLRIVNSPFDGVIIDEREKLPEEVHISAKIRLVLKMQSAEKE